MLSNAQVQHQALVLINIIWEFWEVEEVVWLTDVSGQNTRTGIPFWGLGISVMKRWHKQVIFPPNQKYICHRPWAYVSSAAKHWTFCVHVGSKRVYWETPRFRNISSRRKIFNFHLWVKELFCLADLPNNCVPEREGVIRLIWCRMHQSHGSVASWHKGDDLTLPPCLFI